MNDTAFATIPNAFTEEECDEIVRIGDMLTNQKKGKITGGEDHWMQYYRECDVAWFNEHQSQANNLDFTFMYQKLDNLVHSMMRNVGWSYELTSRQSAQYTSYEKSGRYDWHKDAHAKPYSEDTQWPGQVRKMSAVVLLSDPEDYVGGDLLGENPFKYTPLEYWKRISNLTADPKNKKKGTAFVFPSWAHHKVTPIESGSRKSLVCWWNGPPFT